MDGFGGFISSFLTAFRDDYSKTATLSFGILSGNNVEDLANFDINDVWTFLLSQRLEDTDLILDDPDEEPAGDHVGCTLPSFHARVGQPDHSSSATGRMGRQVLEGCEAQFCTGTFPSVLSGTE